MRTLLSALALAAALATPAGAADFPTKPIRLVVHFPAGSSTDAIGRILAEHVAAKLRQPIVIDNKPGADGAIAATEVKRSPADGYTLLLATNSPMSGVPAMRTQVPYDVLKDFTPITDVGRYTFFVYANAQLPVKTLGEFVALAKSKPGKLTYGAGNVTGQLSFASIALISGIDVTHVPYKGEPPAIIDLIGGRLDAMVATAGTGLPQVQTGKLRALATITPTRSPAMPEVPTVREAGFAQFSIEPWAGLFGPAGVPPAVVATLNKAFTDAMKDPGVLKRMAGQHFVFSPSTPESLRDLVGKQLEEHRNIVRQAGIKPE